jgi:hypothetical protein
MSSIVITCKLPCNLMQFEFKIRCKIKKGGGTNELIYILHHAPLELFLLDWGHSLFYF